MKKTAKKLRLNRQTLLGLEDAANAMGGIVSGSCPSGCIKVKDLSLCVCVHPLPQ